MRSFVLDLLMVSTFWVTPLAWLVAQIVALWVLRGVPRILSALPLIGMIWVISSTYGAWRAESNLWPLLLIFAGFPALVWVVFCLLVGRPKLSKKLLWTTAAATVAFVVVMIAIGWWRTEVGTSATARQKAEGDAILNSIGPRVHVGRMKPPERGPFDPESVQSAVEAQDVDLSLCYEESLRLRPEADTRSIVVELTVGTNGRVASLVASPALNAPALERCMLAAFSKVSFTLRATDAPTVWSVPLRLTPRP